VKKLWLLLLPVALVVVIAFVSWNASLHQNFPNMQRFRDNWALFAEMGSAFQGLGTLFVAIAVGVSFITYNESSERLLETAKIQTENLEVLQRQAAAELITAKVHGLTSRLQGYEEQIGMIRARNSNSMTPERPDRRKS
jgi:hypothetical protein